MKKLLMAASAAAIVAAAPASAQTLSTGNTLTYNVSAEVGVICGVYNAAGTSIDVNFNELATVAEGTEIQRPAGSASYRCNDADGFTRTIYSQNGGTLNRVGTTGGANNSIVYDFQHGGGSGLGLAKGRLPTQSAAPGQNFNGSTAFLNGQTGSVNFFVRGVFNTNGNGTGSNNEAPGTTVFAGNYTDVVTIAVTAR
ncbi:MULTISPECIES: hypothetical protein [unclassified Sphingomonas]|uniref:hypothetical protein n=1 Tax=unclassified Sphingomonas TaxID=196159 RepID=UPI00083718DB|nr:MULTISPECIES: hypothetical protein [unclassified Sphingomonas]